MNVLFVGGSNTRMANGYVANMMSGLRSGWVSRNISVGISGCLMGIEQA